MIRLVLGVRRLEGVAPEDFASWWRHDYPAQLSSSAATLRLHRYVLSEALTGTASDRLRERRGTADPFDAIVELYWLSRRDLYAAGLTPEGIAADRMLIDAERTFIDLGRSVATLTEFEERDGQSTP
jgi:hypothetical protein